LSPTQTLPALTVCCSFHTVSTSILLSTPTPPHGRTISLFERSEKYGWKNRF